MTRLSYIPDDDVKVHEEGAIRLICAPFQSHENGLPEWLKNSADAYARENAPEESRIIVVILDNGRRSSPASISVLDFCGMTSKAIEENFRIWADPDAAKRGSKASAVQGGHGNGGKCYMTQMFEEYSLLTTVREAKGNRYGVVSGSVRFGYIPDRVSGRDFAVPDSKSLLQVLLKALRCSTDALPKPALEALKRFNGFTLITGVGPKGYGNRIPTKQVMENLEEYSQMIRTLELCHVYIVADGEVQNGGEPLHLPTIPPMEGAEEPRIIRVPAKLKDPTSDQHVSTTDGDRLPLGTLTLHTSDVSMRWKRKGRHNVVYRTTSGYIGFVPISELDVQSPYRDRIYGECVLEALDQYKQNDRSRLATSPLTRALERFISQQVEVYAREFEARDRRKYDQAEKDALSKMNEALDKWKNRFLDEYMRGLWGPGTDGPQPPPPPLPSGKPAKIEIGLTHQFAGLGVSFRPTIKFSDASGKQIRPTPYRWVSEDTNVAMVDEDLMVVNTFSYGKTSIHAETLDSKVRSNRLPLEVVMIRAIDIIPSRVELAVGSRQKLQAVCTLDDESKASNIYLVWTEADSSVARVSAAGLVYGFAHGETQVVAGDDHCMAKEPAVVVVTPGQGKGRGDEKGKGYPRVLVSGEIDRDPDTMDFVHFSIEDPPVAQRPRDVDRNIWWINSSAPLARLYLSKERGYGYQSREWRMYHLERYIDVVVQIAITNGPLESASMSANDWIMEWGAKVVEIQAAASSDLVEFIASGQLP